MSRPRVTDTREDSEAEMNYPDHGSRKPLNWMEPSYEEPIRKSTSYEAQREMYYRMGTPPTRRGSSKLSPPMPPHLSRPLILKGSLMSGNETFVGQIRKALAMANQNQQPPQLARPKVPGFTQHEPAADQQAAQPNEPPMGMASSGTEVYSDPFHPAHQNFGAPEHQSAAQMQEQAGNNMAAQAHQQMGADLLSPMDRAQERFNTAQPPQPGMPPMVTNNETPMPGMPPTEGAPPPMPGTPPPGGSPPMPGAPPAVMPPDQNKPLAPPQMGFKQRQGPVPGMVQQPPPMPPPQMPTPGMTPSMPPPQMPGASPQMAPPIPAPPGMGPVMAPNTHPAGPNASMPSPVAPGPGAPPTHAGGQGTPIQPSNGPAGGASTPDPFEMESEEFAPDGEGAEDETEEGSLPYGNGEETEEDENNKNRRGPPWAKALTTTPRAVPPSPPTRKPTPPPTTGSVIGPGAKSLSVLDNLNITKGDDKKPRVTSLFPGIPSYVARARAKQYKRGEGGYRSGGELKPGPKPQTRAAETAVPKKLSWKDALTLGAVPLAGRVLARPHAKKEVKEGYKKIKQFWGVGDSGRDEPKKEKKKLQQELGEQKTRTRGLKEEYLEAAEESKERSRRMPKKPYKPPWKKN